MEKTKMNSEYLNSLKHQFRRTILTKLGLQIVRNDSELKVVNIFLCKL